MDLLSENPVGRGEGTRDKGKAESSEECDETDQRTLALMRTGDECDPNTKLDVNNHVQRSKDSC